MAAVSFGRAPRWSGVAQGLMRRFADTETADEGSESPGNREPGQRDPTRFVICPDLSSRTVGVLRWVVLALDASAS